MGFKNYFVIVVHCVAETKTSTNFIFSWRIIFLKIMRNIKIGLLILERWKFSSLLWEKENLGL